MRFKFAKNETTDILYSETKVCILQYTEGQVNEQPQTNSVFVELFLAQLLLYNKTL